MAKANDFTFDLYRLNRVQEAPSLFNQKPKSLKTDGDIEAIVKAAASGSFHYQQSTSLHDYEWTLSDYGKIGADQLVTLSRSTNREVGLTLAEDKLEPAVSESSPPIASPLTLLFYMSRHILAVEHASLNSASQTWRRALEDILTQSATELKFDGHLEFEPIPPEQEISKAFLSFSKLMRLSVTLRLPNPELSRFAKSLDSQMREGGISEYVQSMKNPRGLNRGDGNLPHATIELAESGYKKGPVSMEGIKNGKPEHVVVGGHAMQGKVAGLKEFVRGAAANSKSKEAKLVTEQIVNEIDSKFPVPTDNES